MSSDQHHTAFFYGTLMAPSVLKRVIHGPTLPNSTTHTLPTNITITPAILPNHRRHRVKNADYPAVIPSSVSSTSPPSTVRGAVVTGLTDGDIWRLDIFEGDEYERKRVTALPITSPTAQQNLQHEPSPDELGEGVECETYIWIAGQHLLEDREWDFEEFVREKMWRWSGEASSSNGGEGEGLAEVDEAVAELGQGKDPTGGRMVGGGGISSALEESRGKEKEILENAV